MYKPFLYSNKFCIFIEAGLIKRNIYTYYFNYFNTKRSEKLSISPGNTALRQYY